MGATKQAKKEKLVPRRELLLKLNEELSQARQDLANVLGDFITELEGILEHIWGENFALNIWWEWHRGGPTVFIRLTGSVQDTLGGLDVDIDHVMDAGYTPLSIALQDKLDTLGMSWYDVRTFGYEYYMNEKELDRFLREFDKLMDSEVQPEAGEKAKSKAKKPMTRRELWMKINQRLSRAYDVIVDVCNELTEQVKSILAYIWGESSILDAWWDWYSFSPVVFIKLAQDGQGVPSGLEKGPIPLSHVITDGFCDLGLPWCIVKIWGHECYVSQAESDGFVQKLHKAITPKVKESDKHV
jgi:hypothetical protein